jgi:hypothetical protein
MLAGMPTSEEIAAIVFGGITYISAVLPVITFWWRFVFLCLFIIFAMDFCLRSVRIKARFTSPYVRVGLSLVVFAVIAAKMWMPMRKQYMAGHMPPSFVYVAPSVLLGFGGAPVSMNTWLMEVEHYGPHPIFNVVGTFDDEDRSQEVRAWGRAHPKQSLSVEQVESESTTFNSSEVDPTDVGAPRFYWRPANLKHEHFFITTASREDSVSDRYSEVLRIEWVQGKWFWKMTVKQVSSGNIIINCQDLGFPASVSELPACFPDFLTKHQGNMRLPFQLSADMPAENRVMWVALMVYGTVSIAGLYSLFALWLMGVF